MEQFSQFIGRFHPLWVHLPIGILLVAVLFDWLSDRKRFAQLEGSVNFLYFLGGLSALFSCLTGFLLSKSGEYGGATLVQHQWLGISTALVALGIYFFRKNAYFKNRLLAKSIATLLLLLVSLTGHLGGSLTHGADYLYVYMPQPFKSWFMGKTTEKPIIEDVQEALVYEDIVVPILKESCYQCHNAQKQKGKLRLDSPDFIAAGGKSQQALINLSNPETSEILRRIHLPLNDDEHMPPNEKDELNPAEKALLAWWIKTGASYEAKVQDLEQDEVIQGFLTALENPSLEKPIKATPLYPEIEIQPADPKDIQTLIDLRAVVLPIGQSSPFLSVNFVNVDPIDSIAMQALGSISEQIVWLKLSDAEFNDQQMALLKNMPHLSKLYLDHTAITDAGLSALHELKYLKYLNLVGTQVSKTGLETLKTLPALERLFIFETATNNDDKMALIRSWPQISIDTGGYIVPTLASDTTATFQ